MSRKPYFLVFSCLLLAVVLLAAGPPQAGAQEVTCCCQPLEADKTITGYVDNDSSGTLTAGDSIKYKVILENSSWSTLCNVTFTDQMPEHTVAVGDATLEGPGGGQIDSQSPLAISGMSVYPGGCYKRIIRILRNGSLPD